MPDLHRTLDAYLDQAPDLAPRTRTRLRHDVNRYLRLRPSDPSDFRRRSLAAGLAAATIETTITTVCQLTGETPGRRLRRPPPTVTAPTIAHIDALTQHATAATWPAPSHYNRRTATWLRCQPAVYWRALIILAAWTGLRLGDLRRLNWSELAAGYLTAAKTGRRQPLHLPPPLRRHIQPLRRHQPLLGRLTPRAARRGLAEISAAAGVTPLVTPQRLRQYAISRWTAAHPMAGAIVHGTGLGVLRHYCDPRQILADVAPRIPLPPSWQPPRSRPDAPSPLAQILARSPAPAPLVKTS